MEKLIVAVDFSDASDNAARYALNMAAAIHASLILFHVVDVNALTSEASAFDYIYPQLEDDAEEKLAKLKKELTKISANKIPVFTKHIIGSVLYELGELCKEAKPFAVVMGAQGKSALNRTLFGSKTNEAVKHLPYPVLVIPANAHYKNIKKIALACDMENTTDNLPLTTLDHLINCFHAQLNVVHVSKSDEAVKSQVLTESIAVEDRLSKYHPSFSYVNNNDVETGINEYVKENQVDLLILIPKMRNVLAAFFHKSLSKRITWHPSVPVMTVHQ